MTELVLQRPAASSARWVAVCHLDDLEECWGEAALVGRDQVALFRLPGNRLHAVGNIDPRTRAAVMARGIVGSRGTTPTIASPLHKEVYDLATGVCLSGGAGLRAYPVRCVDGVVEVGVAA
ncbi:nitrite reductase small subunit NirD [Arthrobacter agilis]|jgi:nitrite reductase (NADH) small subunit|uniref:nitrite reductase small subunit NirD n=1 Tax=Arthrobacter agilis TaxID=37921 RepID=UPI00277EEC3F|nr:nitrite reductase small subunit NirD [Arthrobacter agilis]MDQ0735762.1 nitrite reductase (NADH) small subunit [Arthrobacter agilis]